MRTVDVTLTITMLGWIFTGLLLVLVVACATAGRGALPLNHWFGVRLPALMVSRQAWRIGHAAGVLPASVAFLAAAICSVAGLVMPGLYWGTIGAFVGGVVWVFIRSSAAARHSANTPLSTDRTHWTSGY